MHCHKSKTNYIILLQYTAVQIEVIEAAGKVDDPLNFEIVSSAAANFVSNVPILVDTNARSMASALSDTFDLRLKFGLPAQLKPMNQRPQADK